MAPISQTCSNTFSKMKIFEFQIWFHWNIFFRVKLTICQHWFRQWLGAVQGMSHYLNQCWHSSSTHICGTRGRWIKYLSCITHSFLVWNLVNRLGSWDGPSSANRELAMKLLGKGVSFEKFWRSVEDYIDMSRLYSRKVELVCITCLPHSSRCLAQYCAILPVWYFSNLYIIAMPRFETRKSKSKQMQEV